VIRVGDQVAVQVAKVDTFKKQVDYKLAPAHPPARQTKGPVARPRHAAARDQRRREN
jgi:transcriptional accessory protein Tex/SPT6